MGRQILRIFRKTSKFLDNFALLLRPGQFYEKEIRIVLLDRFGCTDESVQEDIRLTGQFCRKSLYQDNFFWVIRLTGQLENFGRLTVLVM